MTNSDRPAGTGKGKLAAGSTGKSKRIWNFNFMERYQDNMDPDLRCIFTKAVNGEEEHSSVQTVKAGIELL